MAIPFDQRGQGESIPAAAAYMTAGSALFVAVAALMKLAYQEATPMQGVLYRSLFSGLLILAAMGRLRMSLRSSRWSLLLVRGTIGFAALSCYLWAVAHIPLADVLALQQLSPIFVAFLAIWLLGERPGPSHYLLAGVCLIGALLVVRPTRGLDSLDAVAALLSALFSAGAYVSVRALTRTESTLRITFWFSAVATVLSLPLVVPGWRWLSWQANAALVVAGLLAAGGQVMMTASYRRAPAHVASAFSYASVPLAYLAGLLFWGEKPDLWSHLGIGLIVIAGIAIVLAVRPRQGQATSYGMDRPT